MRPSKNLIPSRPRSQSALCLHPFASRLPHTSSTTLPCEFTELETHECPYPTLLLIPSDIFFPSLSQKKIINGKKNGKHFPQEAAGETILTPRFYTTDFDEMEDLFSLEKNPDLPVSPIILEGLGGRARSSPSEQAKQSRARRLVVAEKRYLLFILFSFHLFVLSHHLLVSLLVSLPPSLSLSLPLSLSLSHRQQMDELISTLNEFKTDYNQTHFVRNASFKAAADSIQGPARKIFIEFLERSCTAEFSGFLLYKELGRRLKKSNPAVAEVFTLMSRDEARHAGFLNKAMSDFNLALDLGFLTKNRKYTFFKVRRFPALFLLERFFLRFRRRGCRRRRREQGGTRQRANELELFGGALAVLACSRGEEGREREREEREKLVAGALLSTCSSPLPLLFIDRSLRLFLLRSLSTPGSLVITVRRYTHKKKISRNTSSTPPTSRRRSATGATSRSTGTFSATRTW